MKISKSIYKLVFALAAIYISTVAFAGVNELSDYYKTIRCLVCEGQSIQESDTEFAINLKEQIQKKYNSGISIKEINQELIKIYGEEISFSPPKNHLLLWGAPLILLLIIFILIKNKIRFFNRD